MCALPIWSRLGSTGKADCSSLILVAPAAGRMALAALSLHTQQRAVAAAPSQRVNAIAFEAGHTDKLAVTIDWLAKANMVTRSEEHTSELQSLMRQSYAVFCLKKKKQQSEHTPT